MRFTSLALGANKRRFCHSLSLLLFLFSSYLFTKLICHDLDLLWLFVPVANKRAYFPRFFFALLPLLVLPLHLFFLIQPSSSCSFTSLILFSFFFFIRFLFSYRHLSFSTHNVNSSHVPRQCSWRCEITSVSVQLKQLYPYPHPPRTRAIG